jgi:DNA adenine methylase
VCSSDLRVYCDPPYAETTAYKGKNKISFDHGVFWDWVREQVRNGNEVIVSEYHAPSDFISVYQKRVNNTLVQNTGAKQGLEQLFVHYSQAHIFVPSREIEVAV